MQQLAQSYLQSLGGAVVLILLGLVLSVAERRSPIDGKLPAGEVLTDWMLGGVSFGLSELLAPLTGACAAFIISAAGGGLIPLPMHGPGVILSLAVLVVATDLAKYWWHRAQHAVPMLWALHSFHHSAEAITFITGVRHHWIERVLVAALLPVTAILFKAPPIVYVVLPIIFLPDTCAHTNMQADFGRAVTWINNPQWHRIHHSTRPEHRDKNFAALLPVWDLVFGTAWIPAADEYPTPGLVPGEKVGLIEGVVWPFRRFLPGRGPAPAMLEAPSSERT